MSPRKKAPVVEAPAPQLPLLPESPPALGELVMVVLDRLPPDAELAGPAPTPALIESIRRWGVLEPLLVRAVGGGLDYRNPATLVAGRRRLKAVRVLQAHYRAQLQKISAAHPDTVLNDDTAPGYRAVYERFVAFQRVPVRAISDPEGSLTDNRDAVLAVLTNAVRHDNPVTDFIALAKLLDQLTRQGLTEKQCLSEASLATGMPTGTIKQRLRLLGLSAELQEDFLAGRLGYTVALHASRLGVDSQAVLSDLLDKGEPATLELVKRAKREAVRELQAGLFDGLPGLDPSNPAAAPERDDLESRARFLAEQLADIKMPIMQEAAGVLRDLLATLEEERHGSGD